MSTPADDPLPEAVSLVQGAASAGLALRLLGGLGVRVLCPDFPPRLRPGQDMDLACTGKGRREVAAYLEASGCVADRMFNNLNGDRQMYFTAPSGRPIDVMVDRLVMCHTLDFRPSFRNSSLTLDPADLLLSKLQIVELNAKDAHDITHLLSGIPLSTAGGAVGAAGANGAVAPAEAFGAAGPAGANGVAAAGAFGADEAAGANEASDAAGSAAVAFGAGGATGADRSAADGPVIDTKRFGEVLAADWGWWRTCTGSLEKLPALLAENPRLTPPQARFDPLAQAARLLEVAKSVPKSMKWRLRANVGDRVRWYELPEEVAH